MGETIFELNRKSKHGGVGLGLIEHKLSPQDGNIDLPKHLRDRTAIVESGKENGLGRMIRRK